jgi:hypothetical protein
MQKLQTEANFYIAAQEGSSEMRLSFFVRLKVNK